MKHVLSLVAISVFAMVSTANAVPTNWNYEWNITSATVYGYVNGEYGPVDVTNNIRTSGYLEAYPTATANCAWTCLEIRNFQFTLVDAVQTEYSWSLNNVSIFAATASSTYVPLWDLHLGNSSTAVYFSQSLYPRHDVYTPVGDYGYPYPQDGFYPGGHIHGNWVAVPEPSSMLLLGSGLAMLAAWRRKQKHPSS